MKTSIDIVCVGDLMVECILRLPSLPLADTTLVLDSVHQELGGAAFNICWYLAQFGWQPRVVAPFGLRNRPLIDEAFSSAKLDDSGLIPLEGDTDFLIAILTDYHHHSVYLRSYVTDKTCTQIRARCGQPNRLVLTGSRHGAIRRAFLDLVENFQGAFMAFNPSYAIYEYEKSYDRK